MVTRCARYLLTLWLLWCWNGASQAHDLGSMQITCTFDPGGSYSVQVLVDREHLPLRMARIATADFAEAFLQRSQFLFDDRLSMPTLETVRQGDGPNKFQLQLKGRFAARAKTFAFSTQMDVNEYFLRLKNQGDALTVGFWLDQNLQHPPFDLKQPNLIPVTTGQVIRAYIVLGFTHIVPKGLDHILFVLGLFLLSMRTRPLLLQVTAFTLAHSITLALSIYGVISLPTRIVEPLIALSIACVAFENLRLKEYRPWRPVIVFAFGLLHGLGFAGVLTQLGLPREQFATALVSFNLGVEFGQLAVILAALLGVGIWCGNKAWYRERIVFPASLVIALTGLYWTIERLNG
jgi:hydrogenase/urease accessory protein HupE